MRVREGWGKFKKDEDASDMKAKPCAGAVRASISQCNFDTRHPRSRGWRGRGEERGGASSALVVAQRVN